MGLVKTMYVQKRGDVSALSQTKKIISTVGHFDSVPRHMLFTVSKRPAKKIIGLRTNTKTIIADVHLSRSTLLGSSTFDPLLRD